VGGCASKTPPVHWTYCVVGPVHIVVHLDWRSCTTTAPCRLLKYLSCTGTQIVHIYIILLCAEIAPWNCLQVKLVLFLCACLQVEQLTGLSSSLTSLALRPNPQRVTADNVWHLAGMTQLQDLSLCPLPEACTAPDLQQLLEMPHLRRLQLGTNNAAQVTAASACQSPPGNGLLLETASKF
jgi:hypothetical protein